MRTAILAALLAAGCASASTPRPATLPAELPEPWVGLRASCEVAGEVVTCPRRIVAQADADAVTLWGQAMSLAEQLGQVQALAGVDAAEAGQRVQAARMEAERARAQRWLFGGVGVAVGAVLVVLAGAVR